MSFEKLFNNSVVFQSYTSMHWWPVILLSLFCMLIVFIGKRSNEKVQTILGTCLASMACLSMMARIGFTIVDGSFSLKDELPLHLCRALALIMPFAMYFKHHRSLKTIYFLTTAGTLQAILTPELNYSAPHYEYFIYWLVHVFLFWTPIYAVVIYKVRPDLKSLIDVYIFTNLFLIFTYIVNRILGSNYLYTMRKPNATSLLDVMGPWPIYLLTAQIIGLLLFLIAYLPFHRRDKKY